MLKSPALIATLLFAAAAFSQTATHTPKKSTTIHRATTGPTHVTGAGVTTASGLHYWNIKLGIGALAIPGKKVKVDYTGWLTNGKKFDSSVGSGHPFEFTLGNHEVIKGWDEGIAGMKVGGKRQLRIPPDLAYGAGGTGGGLIPPNATLIFDVRLVAVE
ncbi:MAG TPA: FKBP-type peptidyl-prolyl cis-trans isomerase [Terriglobales bacterium]|nr:FKBP-type peptidyl-prolyl cis-trans isomerase [Terriglobales bacterium]